MSREKTKKITSIGSSALIEGIMMRGPKKTTVAVRMGKDDIYTEDISFTGLTQKHKFCRIPLIRGVCGLIDSMRLSYKSLMISADKAIEAGEIEEEEPSKFEKWLDDKFGDKLVKILMVFASIIGVAFAVALFFFVPSFLYDLVCKVTDVGESRLFKSVFEGVLKIVLFLGYIVICSRMQEMKRVFMYHGAEHTCITCIDHGMDLTVDNVRKRSRFHKRCGTSFLLIVMLVSILFFMFIRVDSPILRVVLRLLLIPVIAGVSYEFIRLAGRSDNAVVNLLSKPGLWLQGLTTKEPDDEMIEVGIASVEAVFDWKPYVEEIRREMK